jgi:hypothetical protein
VDEHLERATLSVETLPRQADHLTSENITDERAENKAFEGNLEMNRRIDDIDNATISDTVDLCDCNSETITAIDLALELCAKLGLDVGLQVLIYEARLQHKELLSLDLN